MSQQLAHTMKRIFALCTISLLLFSCGGEGSETTMESILASDNVETLRKKKDELVANQQALNADIKLIDKRLEDLNPEKNLPLITTIEAQVAPFDHYLELQGSVKTDDNIVVTPEMGGVLTRVYVKEGQRVSKGQILAKIDDGGMSQQLAQMQVQADFAKTTFERQERLWNQKIGSEIQYLQAKSSYDGQLKAISSMQQQLGKSTIRAPFSGTIDDIMTEQGSVVSPGQSAILRIVSLKNMFIETSVPETYITNVVKGKNVEVYFPVLDKKITAKVNKTGNYINPDNRTFRAEIEVSNKDNSIKPNLTARLKINDYSNDTAILIPQSLISENAAGEQYIYVLTAIAGDKAVATRKIIQTGRTQGDVIEVLDGLENGDQVVEEGARSIKDGQEVKIITY